jgi:hypothetical protein
MYPGSPIRENPRTCPAAGQDSMHLQGRTAMSHNHERLLQAILGEPLGANIHWRDVESLLHHLGAAIEPGHGARMKIELNGVIGTLHRPHHSGVCSKQDIRHLRDYLNAAGITAPS